MERNSIKQDLNPILGSPEQIILKASRVVGLESNVDSCMPPVKLTIGAESRDVSQMVYVKYGNGNFLLSLAWINEPLQQKSTQELIISSLARLTLNALVRQEATRL